MRGIGKRMEGDGWRMMEEVRRKTIKVNRHITEEEGGETEKV